MNCYEVENLFGSRNRVDGTRGKRCANLLGNVTRRNLVAELFDCLWARADPDQAGLDYLASELCVFGQKAVAGVNRICARLLGDVQNLFDNEVGLGARGAVQGIGLVG